MNRTRLDPDAQLDASLRRIRGAIETNRSQYAAMVEQIVAATHEEVAERVTAKMADRHQRHIDRHRRREERRALQKPYSLAELPGGFVFGAVSIVCLVLAVLHPALWWLIFVAFGFGMSAAGVFGRALQAKNAKNADPVILDDRVSEPAASQPASASGPQAASEAAGRPEPGAPAEPAEPADPRVVRIQTLCDKLLTEVESGPPIVREVVTQPQATIGGLRQACLEIARRERELRSVLGAQQDSTLAAERDALVARLAAEQDSIVRDRLGQALRALEEQLAHRAELATAASRLEAENTRILYTLESLHMQLLRARSTDVGAPELGGKLRESLRELGTQIDAVAEALEWASAPAGAEPAIVRPGVAEPTPDAADAARAERQDAARRAARASQSERRPSS